MSDVRKERMPDSGALLKQHAVLLDESSAIATFMCLC